MPLRFWRVHGRAKISAKVFFSERIQIRTLFAFGSFRRELIPREAPWLRTLSGVAEGRSGLVVAGSSATR
jgi:hypothetical protein